MSPTTPGVVLVVPSDVDRRPTGGNHYDLRLARALAAAGWSVDLQRVPGAWPLGDSASHRLLRAALVRGAELGYPVVADGLVTCAAPDVVAEVAGAGARVWLLVHLPLALETGLSDGESRERLHRERRAVAVAAGVLVTSRWAEVVVRRDLAARRVVVAVPGVDAAPVATGSEPPLLLQLGALSPDKDQLTVIAALASVADLPWRAQLTGPDGSRPGYRERVEAAVARHGLTDRVSLTGSQTGAWLEDTWEATDLLVLPSRRETFGLAVLEAGARGIPAVVGSGTGAVEALHLTSDAATAGHGAPGWEVQPGDPAALAAGLRVWLTEPDRRSELRARALRARALLPGWDSTAARVIAALAATREG